MELMAKRAEAQKAEVRASRALFLLGVPRDCEVPSEWLYANIERFEAALELVAEADHLADELKDWEQWAAAQEVAEPQSV